MRRKDFIQTGLLAGGGILFQGASITGEEKKYPEDKPFHLNYGVHDGMFKNSAGNDFIDQLKFAHDQGFRSMEDNGMMSRTADMQKKIGDTLNSLGMTMGVFVVAFDNWPLQPHSLRVSRIGKTNS